MCCDHISFVYCEQQKAMWIYWVFSCCQFQLFAFNRREKINEIKSNFIHLAYRNISYCFACTWTHFFCWQRRHKTNKREKSVDCGVSNAIARVLSKGFFAANIDFDRFCWRVGDLYAFVFHFVQMSTCI